jgi:hypothetical protein
MHCNSAASKQGAACSVNQIFSILNQLHPRKMAAGGIRESANGNWSWDDGTPWAYKNWFKDQPDNRGGIQRCITVGFLTPTTALENAEWDDNDCNAAAPFVCKEKSASKPAAC